MVGRGTADRTVDIQDGGGGGGGTGGLTDAELRATAIPVTTQEPISVDDNGGSLTVDGTVAVSNFPATQPVSGTVEVTNDAGNPLPVSGTVSVSEPVSVDDNGGSLTIDGTVTADTELPPAAALSDSMANPTVPGVAAFGMVFDGANWDRMSGDDTGIDVKGPLTDGELRSNPVDTTVQGTIAVEGVTSDGFPPGGPPVLIAGQDGTNTQSLKTDTDGELQIDVLTSPGLTDTQLRATAVPTNDPGLPNTLGQAAMAASTSVVIASDQSAVPVTHPTGTLANGAETAVTTSAAQVLASNASRRGAIIQNVGTGNIRVGITGVTATTGTRLLPMGHLRLSMPYCPTSAIFAIAEAATPTSTVLAQEST